MLIADNDAKNVSDAGAVQASPLAPPSYVQPANAGPAIVTSALATPEEGAANEVSEECLAYREFLAQIADDEKDAADLNALMASELQGGVCN